MSKNSLVWLLSDVSYSDECRTKKYFQYAENMIPLFLVILKFYSSKHLFKNSLVAKIHRDKPCLQHRSYSTNMKCKCRSS